MSDEHPDDDARVRAEELVTASAEGGSHVSTDDRAAIIDALTQDLRAASDQEERLVKIETQTRVLAEAVIAITDTADTVAPAVQAVKDEM